MDVGGLDLNEAAAWATIIGTVIAVTGAILGWLGKLRLRLPANLTSFEARAFYLASIVVIALPILAWGPKAGLLFALANLIVLPPLPGYVQDWLSRPRHEREIDFRRGLVFALAIILGFTNLFALVSLGSTTSEVASSTLLQRISDEKDCTVLRRDYEAALTGYRRARDAKKQVRMGIEEQYMNAAEERMRFLSCPQTAGLPAP